VILGWIWGWFGDLGRDWFGVVSKWILGWFAVILRLNLKCFDVISGWISGWRGAILGWIGLVRFQDGFGAGLV